MFKTFLASIPKSRSDMVNELDLPDDVNVTPYVWTEREASPETSESPVSAGLEDYDVKTLSSDSSLALSRALTDSEMDYETYRRYRNRSFSEPWLQMKAVLDSFPSDYLASVESFKSSSELSEEARGSDWRLHAEELRLKMERFFEEECRVFSPDDPSLLALDEALQQVDLKDSGSISSAQ